MDVPYPKNIVWYIEARPWNGSKAQPGFAPADPSSMGSAVAVQLEHLDQDGNPFQPAKIRQYLLTCGHVVRQAASNADAGWGHLLEEIYCWPPGKGYQRTRPNSRGSGDLDGPKRASVSSISPCQAALGEVPLQDRLARCHPHPGFILLVGTPEALFP